MRSVGKHYPQLRNKDARVIIAKSLVNLHAYVGNLLRSGAELIVFPRHRDGLTAPLLSAA